jgi:hypothetical protein
MLRRAWFIQLDEHDGVGDQRLHRQAGVNAVHTDGSFAIFRIVAWELGQSARKIVWLGIPFGSRKD